MTSTASGYPWGVRGQVGVAFVLSAVLAVAGAYLWAIRPAAPDIPPLAVPTFAGAPSLAGLTTGAARRDTLLPTDCADLLTGPVDASALLGQPMGALGARSVVGVGSPSVGLLERLTCRYERSDRRPTALVMAFAAFTDPDSSLRQRDRNIALERAGARSVREVPLGDTRATLVDQPREVLLMVSYQRYTVTLRLARGVIPDDQAELILTDIARRVWPGIAPPTEPTPATRPPATQAKSTGG